MKIIGKTEHQLIVTVTKEEIEKVFDKYYGKIPSEEFNIGKEFDIGNGYNFRSDIKASCQEMQRAMEQFEKARATLCQFALLVNGIDSK